MEHRCSRRGFLRGAGSAAALAALPGRARAQTTPPADAISLRAVLESNLEVNLDPFRSYVLDRAVTLRDGQKIWGNGAKVFLPRDDFGYRGDKCALFGDDRGVGFRVSNAADVRIDNLKIIKEFENLVKTVAIWADRPRRMVVHNVSCMGFSDANGVMTFSGAEGCTISHSTIHNCHIIAAPGRYQLTGIQFDDCRPGGAYSANNAIIGNLIYNLTAPTFRHGGGLGTVETDGINLQGGENFHVSGNKIVGLGEAIDLFCDNSLIEGNALMNTIMFGVKVTHGASGNIIENNRISITPRDDNNLNTFGVWIVGSSNGPASRNKVLKSEIDLRHAPDGAVGIMIGQRGEASELAEQNWVEDNAVFLNDSGRQIGICDVGKSSTVGRFPPPTGWGLGVQGPAECTRGISGL